MLLVAGLVSHANHYHSQSNEYPAYGEASQAPGSLVPETVSKAASPDARKEAREEADLAAQLRMARSAENAFYVSLLSFFLLAATVIFAGLAWKAAKDTVEETRRIGNRQLRPYVCFDTVETRFLTSGALLVQPRWKNYGQTPALKNISNYNYQIFDGRIPEDFDYPSRENGYAKTGVIAPGKAIPFGDLTIGRTDFNNLKSGRTTLLIWGWTEYRDNLDPEMVHRSEFCNKLLLTDKVSVEDRAQGKDTHFAWLVHGPHNGMDENCLRPPQQTKT